MATNSNPLMTPLDPLPLPKQTEVEMKPAAPPAPMPQGAGYAGKGGQVANIAANFLHGWMSGQELAKQKKQDQARAQVAQSYQMYQNLQNMASDPSIPEDQRKKAAESLGTAWTNYVGTMSKYVTPEEGKGQKKSTGQKIKSGLGKAFGAGTPELTTQSMIEMMQKLTPVASQPRGPTPEQTKSVNEAKESQIRLGRMTDMDNATKELTTLLSNPDATKTEEGAAKARQLAQKINAFSGNISAQDFQGPEAEKLKQLQQRSEIAVNAVRAQNAEITLKAVNKKQQGVPLDPIEQSALDASYPPGQPPTYQQVYSSLKGKTTKDPISGRQVQIPEGPQGDLTALNLATRAEAKQKAMVGQLAYSEQDAKTKNDIAKHLKFTLGRDPSPQEVESEWYKITYGGAAAQKPTPDPKGNEATADTVQSVFGDVARLEGGRFGKFFINKTPPKLGKDGKPIGADKKADYAMQSRENFSAEDQKEYDLAAQQVAHYLQDRGFNNDRIALITGQENLQRAMQMQPPPAAAREQKGAKEDAHAPKKWTVTAVDKNGQKQTYNFTGSQEEADNVKKELGNNYSDIKVDSQKE